MAGTYEMIVCVVNSGFSDAVMSAARACGARGGTVPFQASLLLH